MRNPEALNQGGGRTFPFPSWIKFKHTRKIQI